MSVDDLKANVKNMSSCSSQGIKAATREHSGSANCPLRRQGLLIVFASANLGSMVAFYSGHTIQLNDGKTYFSLIDSDFSDLSSARRTSMNADEIAHEFEQAGAKQKVFLIEGLPYSSDRGSNSIESRFIQWPTTTRMRVIYDANIAVKPDTQNTHSLFAGLLAEGLRGAAAEPDGVITFHSLSNYVSRTTEAYSDVQVGIYAFDKKQAFQLPRIFDFTVGDFALGSVTPR